MNRNAREESDMDLQILKDTPPWEWPNNAGKLLLEVLRDDRATGPDRLLAAELAGDFTVINDELVSALLSILRNDGEPDKLRGQAAISLGPALEDADTMGFEDPEDVRPITEQTFRTIQKSLRTLYMDASVPQEVRRRILEGSVRAQEDWHRDAIRAAYASGDERWRLTAVFCMQYVRGFHAQILDALNSEDPEIHYEAVCAAGNWAIDAAWAHIAALLRPPTRNKPLLLAAIDAVANIRPHEASDILSGLANSSDEDVADAVYEALTMADATGS